MVIMRSVYYPRSRRIFWFFRSGISNFFTFVRTFIFRYINQFKFVFYIFTDHEESHDNFPYKRSYQNAQIKQNKR